MNPLEIQIKALVKLLSEQGIKYIILGGIAVSIYGEPRMTADIDVNIIFVKNKIKKFLKKARQYGFYPAFLNIEKTVRKTGVIPLKFKKRNITGKFDIIIAENILEYNAIKRGRLKKIDSIKARFVSPEDLIIHKISSSRLRDLADLDGILIRQKGKLDTRYIKRWLKKIDKVNTKSKLYRLFEKLSKEANV